MLKVGSNSIGKVYLGSNQIGKAYLGSNLVYQNNVTPQPRFYNYLHFDGTAYINTTIVPPANGTFRVLLGYETLKAGQRIFALDAENSTYIGVMLNSSTTSSTRNFSIFYGSSSASGTGKTLAFSITDYVFFLTPKRYGWGNTAYTYTKGANAPSGGIVLGDNSTHSAGQRYTGWMRPLLVYGSDAQDATSASDIYNNYTPVYTIRPCVYIGEVGVWCVETGQFFGNSAGAGTLTVSD